MSNVSNVTDIILELDKIDSLYRELHTVNEEMQELPQQKEKKKRKHQAILNNEEKKLVEKHVKQLPPLYQSSIESSCRMFWIDPPDCWLNPKNKPDEAEKKRIEGGLNCEVKEKFYDYFRNYDECFLSAVKECDNLYTKALARRQNNYDKIEKEYATKEKDLTDRKNYIEQQLNSITLIPEELFADATRISTMLKQKRADTLKEAINLAFDEKRKDREEAARREEAERQEEILWEQAYENRKHNEAMQRAAEEEARATREHNAAMERAAQAQNDILKKSAESQQRAASARCNTCANRFTCSYEKKQAYSCSSYRSI